jgi:hypothetical protein
MFIDLDLRHNPGIVSAKTTIARQPERAATFSSDMLMDRAFFTRFYKELLCKRLFITRVRATDYSSTWRK